MPDNTSHLQVYIHQLSRRRSQNPFSRNKGLVQCVSFHPIRPYFFVATQRSIRIYNLVKQEMTKKLQTNSKWISSMAVHPGGNHTPVPHTQVLKAPINPPQWSFRSPQLLRPKVICIYTSSILFTAVCLFVCLQVIMWSVGVMTVSWAGLTLICQLNPTRCSGTYLPVTDHLSLTLLDMSCQHYHFVNCYNGSNVLVSYRWPWVLLSSFRPDLQNGGQGFFKWWLYLVTLKVTNIAGLCSPLQKVVLLEWLSNTAWLDFVRSYKLSRFTDSCINAE